MNLIHLGDALDTWKGWLIGSAGICRDNLRVVPMLTDALRWNTKHFKLYANLLGISTNQILLKSHSFSHATRESYFGDAALSQLANDIDLFVDPDTGLKRRVRNSDRHIQLAEIRDLLCTSSSPRIVIVYRSGQETMQTLTNHVRVYASDIGNCFVVAVRGGRVTAVIFSRSKHRLKQIRRQLMAAFQPVAHDRVSAILP